jgi:patatin-like phospholipase/acyl hydrolase
MSAQDVLDRKGPRKLLALDGGGILGLISLGFLARIENLLREKLNKDESFVLADYFDYIAGTSTGAIIAAALALGWKSNDIARIYIDHGQEMFDKDWLIWQKTYNKYTGNGLKALLQQKLGADTTLGSDRLKTLLMVVLRNATTDSPWPVSSNPRAKFNDRGRSDCNLEIPLWKLVRASTAAPTYFPPETVQCGSKEFIFVDGGLTMFNNPAFQLFLMATVDCYRLNWEPGEDNMLLVSIGTGASPDADPRLEARNMNIVYNATHIPSALIAAANAQQDLCCRIFGNCLHGAEIDREVGGMTFPPIASSDGSLVGTGRGPLKKKLFDYLRYNVDLTQDGLDALGLDISASEVQAIDSVAHIEELSLIGKTAAERAVDWKHLQKFS